MISDIAFTPEYWISLILLVAASTWLVGARFFDFRWMVFLLTSQYVVHSVLVFGVFHQIAIFSILFHILFVVSSSDKLMPAKRAMKGSGFFVSDNLWLKICKYYLFIYYLCRLAFYPFFSSDLDLGTRLEAQQDNVLIFNAGLAIMPALAGFVYYLMRPGARVKFFDWVVLIVLLIGMFGSGSKSGLLFLVLAFVGVASYFEKSIFRYRKIIFGMLICLFLTGFLLSRLFPDLSLLDIISLIVFRVAANTDSLEFLSVIGLDPREYPFAGWGAFYPFLAKRLGYIYDYPPGVWLYGVRYGGWSGFGPNPGLVMDYFSNGSWVSLVFPVALGWLMRKCQASFSAVGCSLLSILLYSVIDISVLDICLTIWLGFLVCIYILRVIAIGSRYRFSSKSVESL